MLKDYDRIEQAAKNPNLTEYYNPLHSITMAGTAALGTYLLLGVTSEEAKIAFQSFQGTLSSGLVRAVHAV